MQSLPTLSLNFAFPVINHRSIIDANMKTSISTLGDGTKIHTDDAGRIVQASYSTGAMVKRNGSYAMVQSHDMSLWFGDSKGRWFPLD